VEVPGLPRTIHDPGAGDARDRQQEPLRQDPPLQVEALKPYERYQNYTGKNGRKCPGCRRMHGRHAITCPEYARVRQ